ncbi:MAG: DUF4338 domain-containing protein, partial [Gammaproteobacteria bacterium]|nr:DUF4338 domain-containing protein [Gammaproteobacteria bacterium]
PPGRTPSVPPAGVESPPHHVHHVHLAHEHAVATVARTPVLVETFVEVPPSPAASNRASGWIRVGTTQGRGRCGTDERYGKPNTDVWLRPLAKHWRRILHR